MSYIRYCCKQMDLADTASCSPHRSIVVYLSHVRLLQVEHQSCRTRTTFDEFALPAAHGCEDSLTEKEANRGAASPPAMAGATEVGVVLATRVGLILGGLAIQSVLAYALLPEGRGAYAVCVMFGALFGALFTPGADRGIQYYLMAKRISVSEGMWVSLIICLIGTAIAIATAVPLILSDISFFRKADRLSFFLALPLIPLTAFSTSLQLQLAGLRRFARLALFSVLQITTNTLTLTTFVLVMNLGVEGALISGAVAHGIMIAAMLVDLGRAYGLTLVIPSHELLRRIVRYGLEYHIARIGQIVDVQIGVLFLGMIAGRAEIGLFAVASALMTRMFIISDAVSAAVLPRVATEERGRPELVAFCGRATTWLTGITLAILCSTSIPLTRVLLSNAFLPAATLMWIMAPGVLVYSGTNVLMSYFRGVNRPKICSLVVWAGMIGNLATVLLLYPQIGVAAAAWGMTVGRLCRSAILVPAFVRVANLSPMLVWVPQRYDSTRLWRLVRRMISRAHPAPSRRW